MSNQKNATAVDALEPSPVWRLFAGFSSVPHPSKKEERIRAHVREVAEGMGFAVREDSSGNMVIEVPASPGCEDAPITVLQGHLDMVCEKNAGTQHDFDKDPITLVLDTHDGEQIVRADGTTLGADNGIGLAMGLAAASSPDVKHGPLEILCTVDEEAGMTGAKVLRPDFFKGRRLLNLDSEEDDVIYIGCAGGCDTTLTWEFTAEEMPAGMEVCRVAVSGLRGGHSGGDIHLNRGNAIKLLVQTLRDAAIHDLRVVELAGGSLRNAIPREAHAVVAGPAGTAEGLAGIAADVQAEAVNVNKEEACRIVVEKQPAGSSPAVTSASDAGRLLATLTVLPHGVLAVVPEIPGLVQTSNNVATAATETTATGKLRVVLGCLSRSSSMEQMHATARQIRAAGQLAGADAETGNDYPGWAPDVHSPTLATCRRVYQELFDEEPNVTAIHAGLECGLIGERVGGNIDMVSFGPRIEGAHSPDERVYVQSVQKSWKYLKAVLAELAKG